MRRALALIAAVLAATPAAGQVVSAAPEKAAVVIYRDASDDLTQREASENAWAVRNQGLAFISETRTVELPAGRVRIAFRGVADTMVSETAAIEGLPGAQIERNEDFNLLSPGSLMQASIGKSVKLVRTNRATGQVTVTPAILRAGPDQPVLEVDGHLEGLGCSGAPERLIFEDVPAGLSDKPTLSVLADIPKAGRYTLRLSYLATGFDWRANYVARLSDDGRSLDLIGWLTLANQTAASFADAPTQVVAGELARDPSTVPPDVEIPPVNVSCWPLAGPSPPPPLPMAAPPVAFAARSADIVEEVVVTGQKLAQQSDLGDYKLYTLPEPTTVAARQTKQVLFLDQHKVPVERVYAYTFNLNAYGREDPKPEPPAVVLRLMNKAAAGLGKPLPSGNVAVMEPAEGGPVLAGEHAVKDTPVGLPLEVEIGKAMDVAVTVRVVSDRSTKTTRTTELEVTLANDKPLPIALEYRQARVGDSFRVSGASTKPGVKNGDPMWPFRLAPGERKTLTYTVSLKR